MASCTRQQHSLNVRPLYFRHTPQQPRSPKCKVGTFLPREPVVRAQPGVVTVNSLRLTLCVDIGARAGCIHSRMVRGWSVLHTTVAHRVAREEV